MRILLWDIDGTLIRTGGAGVRALGTVVRTNDGAREALASMRLDGMTDRRIARLLAAAQRHRAAPELDLESHAARVGDDEIAAMLDAYLLRLREGLAAADGEFEVLAGVVETLDRLEGTAVHALGTGNLEEGARLKLLRGGLWHRFAFGGFGSDAEERPEILRAAWRKAERHLGRRVDAEELVVIGDTPKDVAAARAVGFACVAVASGRYDVDELAGSGADEVLSSLAAPDAAARIVSAQRSNSV
jgi:phosphoglycolate phosphatase